MSNEFEFKDDGKRSAFWHMEQDHKQIESLQFLQKPLVRAYEWQSPVITYGCFIHPHQFLNLETCARLGFEVARRPTGGGILFHGIDIPFSVAIPKVHPRFSSNILENYQWINKAVLKALSFSLQEISLALPSEDKELRQFCMARPTQYDIMINGYKIGGAAQRKTQFGYLHQSSIFLSLPSWDLIERMLLDGTKIVAAMKGVSKGLFDCSQGASENEIRKKFLSMLLMALNSGS